MSFDYSSLASVSVAQIADKGRNVTYRIATQGTYDPQTDAITSQSTSTKTVKAVIINARQNEIDGTLIKKGDKFALIADDSLTFTPKTNDVIFDGDEYTVKNIKTVKPGNTVLLYKLQLRK